MMSSAPVAWNAARNRRDLGGIVLAVGVEGHHGRRTVLEGVPEPGPERGPLACVRPLDEDRRACSLGLSRGVVGRAVVDDHDGQDRRAPAHDGRDPRSLLVARDERDDVACFVHGIGPVVAPPPGIRTWDLPLRRRLLCPLSYGDVAEV